MGGYTESAALKERRPKPHSTFLELGAFKSTIHDPRHLQTSKYCHKLCHIFEHLQVASFVSVDGTDGPWPNFYGLMKRWTEKSSCSEKKSTM